MKTIKIYKYILLFSTLAFVFSCEDQDTFLPELTNLNDAELFSSADLDIDNSKNLSTFVANMLLTEAINQTLIDANSSEEEIEIASAAILSEIQSGSLTLAIPANTQIEGYVISNDAGGNFFEELIIQNSPANPTIGVRVMIDVNPLNSTYEIGRKIFVNNLVGSTGDNLNLFFGLNDGVLAIGGPTDVDGGGNVEVSKINGNLVEQNVIMRSIDVEAITPKLITTADFNDANENLFISLENMQFPISSVFGTFPGTFASENGDEFNGERLIQSCNDDGTIEVSTSSFANYIAVNLPNGNGTINGILARDFFDDKYIFKINEPSDIIFENGVAGRCDPIFVESFENLDQWTTFSVTGDQQWGITTFGNPAPSARISGFSGGAVANEDWLISHAIDLTNTTNPMLNFQTVKRFDGPDMEVYISTDYNGGDPTTDGSWTQVSAVLDSNTGSWTSWTNSGAIDVSTANGGDLFIAFKYISSSSSAATFEVDNVAISDN